MYKLLCGKCWKRTKEYRFKVGKPEGKTPAGKHRRILEDNIKTDLKETAWYGVTWSGLGFIWLRIGISRGLLQTL
jgi:hypothetical protein